MNNDNHLYFNIVNQEYMPYQPQLYKDLEKYKSFKKLWENHGLKLYKKDPQVEFEKLKKLGIKIITILDAEYPESLKNIPSPPLGFYLLGEMPLNFPLAIVGTRKAGHYGLSIATKFAKALAGLGVVIVSGLAYGIDSAAHKGTVEIGGKTIAVLGEGIDLVLDSPKRNLVAQILETGGGVISEFPLGAGGLKGNFPLRNRIVSGLSLGTIVIEAPIDSGALITARLAMEQGKEVFVVPAEIVNKNFEGSHRLIQQGAKLITTIDDILTEFDFHNTKADAKAYNELFKLKLSPAEEEIFNALKIESLDLMGLQEELDMSTGELLSLLTHLEIKGIIKNIGGKFICTGS
ncbi:MAG: DNA-processing protein DprA [Patescibacteria group bacterium]